MVSKLSTDTQARSLLEQLLQAPDHWQRVERIARKHTRGSTIHWQDAAQAAHEKVILATQAGKFCWGDMEAFERWATAVAKFAIIDFVRKEQHRSCYSLDQPIAGTDLRLSDTIADDFNLLDAVERADLLVKVVDAIAELDQHYPERGYLNLWEGLKQGKTETQLAAEWQCHQGTISKRKKELCQRIAERLGLLEVGTVQQALKPPRTLKTIRARSNAQW